MKKRKTLISTFVLMLSFILLLTSSGCSQKAAADGDDLMKDIQPESVEKIDSYIKEDNIAAMNFSLELFKMNLLCQNTLISPVSVLSALGMTANGARETTLSQM